MVAMDTPNSRTQDPKLFNCGIVEWWNCGTLQLWHSGIVEQWNCGTVESALPEKKILSTGEDTGICHLLIEPEIQDYFGHGPHVQMTKCQILASSPVESFFL